MKEQVVIERVQITKKSQIKHFQVKIPRSAVKIIGVESGVNNASAEVYTELAGGAGPGPIGGVVSFLNSLIIQPGIFIGELKLQSQGKTNIFYAKDLYIEDKNVFYGDFSALAAFGAWSHGRKLVEEEIEVNAQTTVINGVFRDRIGEALNADVAYQVNVYLWYEVKDEKNDD